MSFSPCSKDERSQNLIACVLFIAIFPIKDSLLPHPAWSLGQKSFKKFRLLFRQWSFKKKYFENFWPLVFPLNIFRTIYYKTRYYQIGCIPSFFSEIPNGDPIIEIVCTSRSKFLTHSLKSQSVILHLFETFVSTNKGRPK